MVAGTDSMIQLLIKHGADVNESDNKGVTPLAKAIAHQRLDSAKLLIAAGADVNCVDNMGYTPLIAAVERGDEPAVKLLLKSGADMSILASTGRSVFEIASNSGMRRLLKAHQPDGGGGKMASAPVDRVLTVDAELEDAPMAKPASALPTDDNNTRKQKSIFSRFRMFSSSAGSAGSVGSATGGHNTDSVIKEIPQPDAASPQEKPGASLERSTGQVGSAANRTRADHSRAQTQTAPILTPEPASLRELDGSSNVVTATATAIAEVGDNLEDRVIRLERLVKAQEEIIQQQAEDIALLKRAAGVTALSAQPSTSGQQS